MKRILAAALLCLTFACHAEEKVLTFGIVPQQAAHKLAAAWSPVLDYLTEKSGHRLQFATAPSIPEFEARCAKGEYDIAYMNPYHYTVYSENPGYRAFANQANKKIQGIMVVKKDSQITALEQLADKPLAFPAPAAFAASILTRASLQKNNIPFTPSYVYSHDAVYKAVASGNFAAGGGIMRTFKKIDPSVRDQLSIFWTSDKYTPHAIAALPDVQPQTVDAIRQAMAEMHQTDAGRALLKPLGFSAIQPAQDSDWDDVRELMKHFEMKDIGELANH